MNEYASLRDQTFDVIIVGSGAAGLTSALTASFLGLRPVVLEAADTFGGTTAVSGGVLWVPANDRMRDEGIEDDTETAIAYVERVAEGRASRAQIARWLYSAPKMARDVETWLASPFLSLPTYPDYQPELPGGKTGGRSLDNALFATAELGEHQPKLRKNPITGRAPMTIGEAMKWGVFSKPFDFPYRDVAQRAKDGIVHGGAALIGRMLKTLIARDVPCVTGARVRELIVENGRVVGVEADTDAGRVAVLATRGVVLASGGFEWNDALNRAFLRGVPEKPTSPKTMQGDALHMAQGVRAQLANMAEAWWVPAVEVPGEVYEDAPLYRSEFAARCLPHSVIVNQKGRRFVNEALNYNDVVKPFFEVDPVRYTQKNAPAWLIVDAQYLQKYMFVTAVPGRPLPEYVVQGDSLEELAERCGIDAAGLSDEMARFNTFVENGVDADFHRGEGAFERFYGDPTYTKNPNIGSILKPPFAAVRIYPSAIGTKGGPVVDEHARVMRIDGSVMPGLYAAGNAMASPAGTGYPGAGSTISVAMTYGWLAARHAADSAND